MNKSNIEITPTPGDGTMFFNGHSANLPAYASIDTVPDEKLYHNEAVSAVRHLSGRIFTLLDAIITNEKQLKSVKDIVRNELSETYSWLYKAAYKEANQKILLDGDSCPMEAGSLK